MIQMLDSLPRIKRESSGTHTSEERHSATHHPGIYKGGGTWYNKI